MTDTMIRTGNAVPSAAPEDRFDNSIALDLAANSPDDSYRDRENNLRRTLKWMERAATGIPAVEAANKAEQARDAAMLSAGMFATPAAGIAATTDGKYFTVPGTPPDNFISLYKNTGGVASLVLTYPSKVAVDTIMALIQAFTARAGVAYSFDDQSGFPIVQIKADGAIKTSGSTVENFQGDALEMTDEYGMIYNRLGLAESTINGLRIAYDTERNGISFEDQNGFVVARISNSATFFGLQEAEDDGGFSKALIPQLGQQQRTKIKQVIVYGQSLSRGSMAKPPISVSQPYGNLMLKGGVKTRVADAWYDASEFVPLIETVDTETSTEGETPSSGLCNGITRRALEIGERLEDWTFAAMSPGAGGRSVEQLSPKPLGEGQYDNMLIQIADTKTLCDSLDQEYSVWCYFWVQGEANHPLNMTEEERTSKTYLYSQRQMYIFDGLSEQIMEITGQKFRPYLFTYQVNAHRRYSFKTMPIALAHWRLSKSRPDVVVSTPCYIFPVAEDNLHLTAEGSWLMGEYTSRAAYVTMINRAEKWRPLEPVSVKWADSAIIVKYHVPGGKLVIDTALATQAQNQGFDLWIDPDTLDDKITTVEVISDDEVRINLSAPADPRSVLSYARGRSGMVSGPVVGARGNVRDTMGDFDKATSPSGVEHSLHNASVAFEYNRKTGF